MVPWPTDNKFELTVCFCVCRWPRLNVEQDTGFLLCVGRRPQGVYGNWGLEYIWRENLASYWWLMSTFTVDDECSSWRWLIPTGRTCPQQFLPSQRGAVTLPHPLRGAVTSLHPLWILSLRLFQTPHIRRGTSSHGWFISKVCSEAE